MGLNQERVAFYLRQVDNEREFRDVVTSYLFQKYINGRNSEQVLLKLRYLCLYLKTSPDTAALVHHYSTSLTWIAFHVRDLNGGSIGSTPGISPLGREAWNEVRRSAKFKSLPEGETWGLLGPGAVRSLPWVATREEQELELRSMDPLTLELLGSPGIPSYRTETLPEYLSRTSRGGVGAESSISA